MHGPAAAEQTQAGDGEQRGRTAARRRGEQPAHGELGAQHQRHLQAQVKPRIKARQHPAVDGVPCREQADSRQREQERAPQPRPGPSAHPVAEPQRQLGCEVQAGDQDHPDQHGEQPAPGNQLRSRPAKDLGAQPRHRRCRQQRRQPSEPPPLAARARAPRGAPVDRGHGVGERRLRRAPQHQHRRRRQHRQQGKPQPLLARVELARDPGGTAQRVQAAHQDGGAEPHHRPAQEASSQDRGAFRVRNRQPPRAPQLWRAGRKCLRCAGRPRAPRRPRGHGAAPG